jgi:hypothetical protein
VFDISQATNWKKILWTESDVALPIAVHIRHEKSLELTALPILTFYSIIIAVWYQESSREMRRATRFRLTCTDYIYTLAFMRQESFHGPWLCIIYLHHPDAPAAGNPVGTQLL